MKYSQKVLKAAETFVGTKYEATVQEAVRAYVKSDYKALDEALNSLPTEIQLLDNLLEKIKNKSVFKTLKGVINNEAVKIDETLVGLSSLLTYIAIECKESSEYKGLFKNVHNKIGELIKHI